MAKKAAVVAVNPVNGMGLFQYLETFFENKIPCTVFAVAESREIRTNSGIGLTADDVIANLKGHEEEYDALVFACGDAVPVSAQHAGEPWNRDLMEVLKTFGETGKPMIGHCAAALLYDNLGIARLIYQLPTTVCEMFLREVFKQGSIESLDQETLFTIQRFFENNLNVSETSRGLFVHRNTLVYRLEKIKKLTGLDLREFDDAIVFKVALMVKKYLSNNPAKY
mgnify:FL=1